MTFTQTYNWHNFVSNYGMVRAERFVCSEWDWDFDNEIDLVENRILLIEVFGLDTVERILAKYGIELPQIMISIFRLME